jgi:hypothetical protein
MSFPAPYEQPPSVRPNFCAFAQLPVLKSLVRLLNLRFRVLWINGVFAKLPSGGPSLDLFHFLRTQYLSASKLVCACSTSRLKTFKLEGGSFAWKTKHRVKRGFALCQGARKKRVGCSVLALPPSGDTSLSSTPLQTESLGQCVQTCVRLFNLPFKNL